MPWIQKMEQQVLRHRRLHFFSTWLIAKSVFLCHLHIQNYSEMQGADHTTDDNKKNPQLFPNDTEPGSRPLTPARNIYHAEAEKIEKKPGTAHACRPCSSFQVPAHSGHTVFHGMNNWPPTRYYWQGCSRKDIYRAWRSSIIRFFLLCVHEKENSAPVLRWG